MQALISTAKLYSQSQKINEVYIGKDNIGKAQIFILVIDTDLRPLEKFNEFVAKLSRSWHLNYAGELMSNVLADISNRYQTASMAVMAVYEDEVICVTSPGIGLAILRSDNYGILLNSQSKKFQITKGKLKVGDVLFFGTEEAFLLGSRIKFLLRQKFPDEYSSHSFLTLGGSGVIYRCNSFSDELNESTNVLSNEKNKPDKLSAGLVAQDAHKNFLSKFENLKHKLLSQRSNENLGYLPSDGQMFLNTQLPKQNQPRPLIPFIVSLFCLAILFASIFFGFLKKQEKEKRAVFEAKTDEIKKELEEAIALSEVAPEKARDVFSSAQEKILGLASEDNSERVMFLLQTIEENKKKLLGEYPTNINQFVDLTLLSSNFSGEKIVLSDNSLYVWDKDGSRLAKIVIPSKRSEILAGPSPLKGVMDINVYTNKIYFFYENGIKQLGDSAFLYEGSLESHQLFYSYASNFYIVQKDNQVLRMTPDASGRYSEPKPWLREGSSVDFSNARQIVIDGAIWVLSDNSKITKMSNGIVQPFKMTGISPRVDQIARIYTSQDSKYLSLLDSENGRIIFLDKEGKFVSQYVSESIKDAIDFAVSEPEKKTFLLTGNKVLFFELGHLDEI